MNIYNEEDFIDLEIKIREEILNDEVLPPVCGSGTWEDQYIMFCKNRILKTLNLRVA